MAHGIIIDIDLKQEPPDEQHIKDEVDIEEYDLLQHPQVCAALKLAGVGRASSAESIVSVETEVLRDAGKTATESDIKLEWDVEHTACVSSRAAAQPPGSACECAAMPYECDICHHTYHLRSLLLLHMRTHTGEKPFKCNLCERGFKLRHKLAIHKRTHTGEKPLKCDICKERFSLHSTLAMHMRTHTGEKPYKCNQCDFKCTQSSNLTRHMITHTRDKPFKCDRCDYKCVQRSTLTIHIRTHTGEKPYNCNACDFKCSRRCSLVRHIMRTHTRNKS